MDGIAPAIISPGRTRRRTAPRPALKRTDGQTIARSGLFSPRSEGSLQKDPGDPQTSPQAPPGLLPWKTPDSVFDSAGLDIAAFYRSIEEDPKGRPHAKPIFLHARKKTRTIGRGPTVVRQTPPPTFARGWASPLPHLRIGRCMIFVSNGFGLRDNEDLNG